MKTPLDIMIGEGPAARSLKLELQPFTLVGATTRAGLLTSPLRDRFGIVQRLEFYNVDELSEIVTRSARKLDLPIEPEGAAEISHRSRGTPRISNRLLRRVRDVAEVKGDGVVTAALADDALNLLNVDKQGFDAMDRRLLLAIVDRFGGGPVGLDALAASISEERGTIEDVLEPYLIQPRLSHAHSSRARGNRQNVYALWAACTRAKRRHHATKTRWAPAVYGPRRLMLDDLFETDRERYMNQPLSVYELIANASLLVQGVMGLLVIASVVSWMMILQRWSLLRRARYEIDSFEDHFWSGIDLRSLH